MAQPIHHHHRKKLLPMVPFLRIVAFLLLSSTLGAPTNKSLTLEVIHRDSIHSPLYPGNLSSFERIHRHVMLSKFRLRQLQLHEKGIRPIIDHISGVYIVKIGIGSPPMQQYLHLDTGSELVWIQCHPCNPCFPQNPPLYKPASSNTYQLASCNHPLCAPYPCHNGSCHYEERYFDRTFTIGDLATERFTFATSKRGSIEIFEGLVFGCSRETSKQMFPKRVRRIAGLLAMNQEPKSFAMQVTSRLSVKRFSYCLVPNRHRGISYLRFGDEVVESRNQQKTPFLTSDHYFLGLEDLSFNHQKLNLPPGTFKINPDGTGGCLIDSGSDVTFLVDPAYQLFKSKLSRYFASYNVTPINGSKYGLDLCYKTPPRFEAYPMITLHFQRADLYLEPNNLFEFVHHKHHICATFLSANRTLLGSRLQQNTRFVYDLAKQELRFARANCARA